MGWIVVRCDGLLTSIIQSSLVMTLAGILPPCVLLFLNPQKRLLPLGLSACAWSFFMFSFQVHEKSVLLPLLPATLLLAGSLDRDTVSWVAWMNNIAIFRSGNPPSPHRIAPLTSQPTFQFMAALAPRRPGTAIRRHVPAVRMVDGHLPPTAAALAGQADPPGVVCGTGRHSRYRANHRQ